MFSTTTNFPSNTFTAITVAPKFFKPNLHNETSLATGDQQVIISIVIAILAVWSIFGNCFTILAIVLHRRMRTKCNLFILSLALSDFLSAAIASPLWLYRRTWGFYHWEWGQFLCKLFWFVDESTSYCTALHIASFSVWRLTGVKWPRKFEETKLRRVAFYLFILWMLAIIFGGFIFSSFYDVTEKKTNNSSRCWPSCSISLSDHGVASQRIYYTFSSTTFMLFPMLILFIASILIVRELQRERLSKSQSRKEKEKKAAVQLGLIATSFLIGYIPMMSYVMWTTREGGDKSCLFDYWFHIAAYLSLRFSECVNPLVYNLACRQMRKASLDVLWKIRTCCRYENKEVEQYSKEYRRGTSRVKRLSSGNSNLNERKNEIALKRIRKEKQNIRIKNGLKAIEFKGISLTSS